MTRFNMLLIGLFLSTSMLEAAVYKGQKIYIKKCRVCHLGGEKIAAKRTMQAWDAYFQHKASNIISVHTGSQRVADQIASLHAKGEVKKLTNEVLESYFSNNKFKKDARHLRDFLVEYAKDSGNVPACN